MSLLDSDGWPHLVSISHTEVENDDYAGHTQESGPSYISDQPAWVQEASEAVIREFKYVDQRVSHTIYLETNPGVNLNDDVTVHGAPFEGKRLGVKGFGNCTVGFDILFRLVCEEYRQSD